MRGVFCEYSKEEVTENLGIIAAAGRSCAGIRNAVAGGRGIIYG